MDRRLITILAADIAGYSRLMAEDEEGVIRRLQAARAEVVDRALFGAALWCNWAYGGGSYRGRPWPRRQRSVATGRVRA